MPLVRAPLIPNSFLSANASLCRLESGRCRAGRLSPFDSYPYKLNFPQVSYFQLFAATPRGKRRLFFHNPPLLVYTGIRTLGVFLYPATFPSATLAHLIKWSPQS